MANRPRVTSADPMTGSAQVHGGVHGTPWQFESVVRVGAAAGALTRPRLLLGRRAAVDFHPD